MRVLGIDPGIATTGYGIVETKNNILKVVDYNCITTLPELPIGSRLKSIYDGMLKVIEKFKPDHVAVEELFFAKNLKTAISVSEARGVIILAATKKGILEIYEYTPLQVKLALVGYGRAQKNQIQQMVKILLNLNTIPKPDDIADALAVAICHINYKGLS
ncbi:MAG: crossover junction endodeoxyribonuclease RuvC [Candidatus Firestonebacteria bacterium]